MGCKPWLKVGTLLLGGVLLCGCQDQSRRDNALTRAPDPQFPKMNTGSGAGAAPGNVWNPNGTGFNNTSNTNNLSTPAPLNTGGLGATDLRVGGPGANNPAGFNSQIQPPPNTGLAAPASPRSNTPSDVGVGGASPIPPVGGSGPALPPNGGFANPSPASPFTPGQPPVPR